MTIELTPKGTIDAVDYDLADAPDLPTAKGRQTMRPTTCTVKFFGGEVGKVAVRGPVVSTATGRPGKRIANEEFVLIRPGLPDVVHEIARAAEAEQHSRPNDATIELTRTGNRTTATYGLAGAPDVSTAGGKVTMRPSWCEVMISAGVVDRVEVHGNVISQATGTIGNRLGTEVFVVADDELPPFVAEIVALAESAERARTAGS